jgi:phosphodiesterase/alkaline phosphatase D-like protein
MNKLPVKLSVTAMVGGLLCVSLAQMLSPTAKAQSVAIIQQPNLESAHDDTAILRWTTTTPRGSTEHFAVVQYGTTSNALTQTAKSHVRINAGHSDTIFRVRIDGLQPQTTYYYKVTSTGGDGTSDGVESDVNQFTTPPPGQRIINYPQPK